VHRRKPSLIDSVMTRIYYRNHTVLPATHTFIHEWNEPSSYLARVSLSGERLRR